MIFSGQISKKSKENLQGRNDGNIRVIVPHVDIPIKQNSNTTRMAQAGDYVLVRIENSNSQVLQGIALYHSSITEYFSDNNDILLCN